MLLSRDSDLSDCPHALSGPSCEIPLYAYDSADGSWLMCPLNPDSSVVSRDSELQWERKNERVRGMESVGVCGMWRLCMGSSLSLSPLPHSRSPLTFCHLSGVLLDGQERLRLGPERNPPCFFTLNPTTTPFLCQVGAQTPLSHAALQFGVERSSVIGKSFWWSINHSLSICVGCWKKCTVHMMTYNM